MGLSDKTRNILKEYSQERGLSLKTMYGYSDSIKKYESFLNKDITSLIKLYEKEEESKRWKHSTLKKNLVGFRNYLYSNFLKNTAKVHFGRIQTFLKHYEIEIGHIPQLSKCYVNDNQPINFNDLLTRNELKTIIDYYSDDYPILKPLIYFMTSSGCSRRETLNIKIEDYLKANNLPISNENIIENISSIDIEYVPLFRLKRMKTNKFYFTYCSIQANESIKNYLLNYRKNLNKDSCLFKINHDYLNTMFKKINDELNLGYAGKYRRLRSHMFRKYHASTLYNNGLHMEDIDELQGRGKDSTHQSYFMENPEILKEKYINHMGCLVI